MIFFNGYIKIAIYAAILIGAISYWCYTHSERAKDVPYGLDRIRAPKSLKVATPFMDKLSMVLNREMNNGI